MPLGALALTSSFGITQPPRTAGVHWKKRQKEIQRFREKHGTDRSLARQFPDLKVEQRTAPCTNGMRGSTARRAQAPGMKQFPVGHSHKQGLELITPGTERRHESEISGLRRLKVPGTVLPLDSSARRPRRGRKLVRSV